jgi:uncharacterized membrane protein YccF (DUF307 family)
MIAIGNFLWFVFGGAIMGLAWMLVGVIAVLTVVGIPWARSCFVIGKFAFLPFGREAIDREELFGRGDIGTGVLGFIGNVVWFLLAGLWLAMGHVLVALCLVMTIIGIPFAIAHLKLAGLALWPVGRSIVRAEVAAAAHRANAEARVRRLRGSF